MDPLVTGAPSETVPLDAIQLKRIEATHRGFLYQHLYAVGCLLTASSHNATAIVVELDEDIEVQFPSERVYLQIKTRSDPIQPSDLDGVFVRFAALRAVHASGARPGNPQFVVVCNAPPSPGLAQQLANWPADVRFVHPGTAGDSRLPPAWTDLASAVAWCRERSGNVQFTKLEPATMVWKLAAHIAWKCTGASHDHIVSVADLPELFELVVSQLQRIPAAPRPYYPQQNEPGLLQDSPVQLVVGISGAGKTAWVADQAMQVHQQVVFFNATGTTGSTLAGSIAREVCAAVMKAQGRLLGEVLRPGNSGLDALRAIDRHVGVPPIVVIDNAHAADPEVLADVVRCSQTLKWALLSHPGVATAELAARLGVAAVHLEGWSADTVARVLSERGCSPATSAVQKALRVTGGLPLHVLNLATLAREKYAGDVGRLCSELLDSAHLDRTAQERLLGGVCRALPADCRRAMAVLELCDVPLAPSEIRTFLERALGTNPASCVRTLFEQSIVHDRGQGRIALHDAFRMNARELRSELKGEELERAWSALEALLATSFFEGMEPDRLRLYIAVLAKSGKSKAVIDIVSNLSEWIQQLGIQEEVYRTVEAVRTDLVSAEDRFWLLDALVFMDIELHDLDRAEERLAEMKVLHDVQNMKIGPHSRGAIALKEILIFGGRNDLAGARSVFEAAVKGGGYDESMLRVLRYDLAVAALGCDDAFALEAADGLVRDYLTVLGLRFQDIIGKNPPEILRKISGVAEKALDIKRLADCFELAFKAAKHRGMDFALHAINAMKFYAMAGAHTSSVRMGQDVADFLLRTGPTGPQAACEFLENTLLPGTAEVKLVEQMFSVRAQYAVVLAWCGRFDDARREVEALEPYALGLSGDDAAQFRGQVELIRTIEDRGLAKSPEVSRSAAKVRSLAGVPKVGRNDPCPCGSGKKHKKCCGR